MSLLGNLFRSSIGRKFIMAITGLVLTGFVAGHLVGNLQIFSPPDKLNGYAHFLQSLGPALWAVRLVLLACVVLHVWAAIALTLENKTARGPEKYGVHQWIAATVASRYMRVTGFVVLAFIVYHLAHFTLGVAGSESFKTSLPEYRMTSEYHLLGIPVVPSGIEVHDVYSMTYLGFANSAVNPFGWLISLFYIVAVGLLTVHLWHGADSMFQTFGWRNSTWSAGLRKVVGLLCLLYFLGNLLIPGAILTGMLKPAAGTVAAQQMAAAPAPAVVQR
ncbi:MAG TPA: succinate dehydrogenase cytochrome b subunit [Opitutaceae bacterium]